MAKSHYTFAFMNPNAIPSVPYILIVLPECFSVDYNEVLIKLGKANGATEYTEALFKEDTRKIWFYCNGCVNFTVFSIINGGISCSPN